MATANQHLQKAVHNEAFVASFDFKTTQYLDWAVTGIFYAALHYIRALASASGFSKVSSYGEVDKLFNTLSPLKKSPTVYQKYRFLKDESREARYDMRRFNPKEVSDMITDELSYIKSFVKKSLP